MEDRSGMGFIYQANVTGLVAFIDNTNLPEAATARNHCVGYATHLKKPSSSAIAREIDKAISAFKKFEDGFSFPGDYNSIYETMKQFEIKHEEFLKNQNLRNIIADLYAAVQLDQAYRVATYQLRFVRHHLMESSPFFEDAENVTLIFPKSDNVPEIITILNAMNSLYVRLSELLGYSTKLVLAKVETGSPLLVTISITGGTGVLALLLFKDIILYGLKKVLPLFTVSGDIHRNELKQEMLVKMSETVSVLKNQGHDVGDAEHRLQGGLNLIFEDMERIVQLRPTILIDSKTVASNTTMNSTSITVVQNQPGQKLLSNEADTTKSDETKTTEE